MKQILVIVLLGVILAVQSQNSCPSGYFSEADAQTTLQLVSSFKQAGGYGGIKENYFAVSARKKLGQTIDDKAQLCSSSQKLLSSSATLETLYYAISLVDELGCQNIKVEKSVVSTLEDGLESENLKDIYYSVMGLKKLGENDLAQVDESEFAGVLDTVISLMNEDGEFKTQEDDEEATAYNTGLACEIVAAAGDEDSAEEIVSTMGTLFSLAEDGEEVVFTQTNALDNVCATASIWNGVNVLSKAFGGLDIDITYDQVVGLGEFFVQNKKVTSLRDANCLLTGLSNVADNSFATPLVLTLSKGYLLTSSREDVSVRVTDIFGQFAADSRVYLVKAFPIDDEDRIILRDQAARPGADKTSYSFNFLNTKPGLGYYSMEFSVVPQVEEDSTILPIEEITRNIKIVSSVSVPDFELAVVDSIDQDDRDFASKYNPSEDGPLKEIITANALQYVIFSFSVKSGNKPVTVHQAFIHFSHVETGKEVIFVAEQDNSDKYSLELNLRDALEFDYLSGKYDVSLIIGDSFIDNSFKRGLATMNINFGKRYSSPAVQETSQKPEILHEFRTPEKRPPQIVSLVFAGATVAVPFALFLIGLGKVGANASNMPGGGSFIFVLGFHICIGAIIGLYTLFWLQLNLVQTVLILSGLIVASVFFGLKTLRALQAKRHIVVDKKKK